MKPVVTGWNVSPMRASDAAAGFCPVSVRRLVSTALSGARDRCPPACANKPGLSGSAPTCQLKDFSRSPFAAIGWPAIDKTHPDLGFAQNLTNCTDAAAVHGLAECAYQTAVIFAGHRFTSGPGLGQTKRVPAPEADLSQSRKQVAHVRFHRCGALIRKSWMTPSSMQASASAALANSPAFCRRAVCGSAPGDLR